MSSNTPAAAAAQATEVAFVPTSKTVKFNGQDLVISTIPPKSNIEDGQHFLSANDRHCYMLPRKVFDLAVKYSSDKVVAEATAAWTVEELKGAITWARARLDEKNKNPEMHIIMPVSKEKAHDALGMYLSSLWALRKGADAELGRRDGAFFATQGSGRKADAPEAPADVKDPLSEFTA